MSKWKQLGIDIAARYAEMSKDPSTKVGACIMDGKFQVSAGYNGPPMGVRDDNCDRDTRIARTLHAELNAILAAKRDLAGCTIYVTHMPCSQCAAIIIQAGIEKIVCPAPTGEFAERWAESIHNSYEMFREADVYLEGY